MIPIKFITKFKSQAKKMLDIIRERGREGERQRKRGWEIEKEIQKEGD